MENQYPQVPQQPDHPSGIPPAERQWAMFSHLSAFCGFVIPPIGHVLGPLIMYLIKKDQYPFGTDQAKEALNFNLSCSLYFLIAFALCLVFIGFILIPALGIFWLIFTIIAAIKANEGVAYRYPATIRFVN